MTLEGKKILVTGGTGSFGRKFIELTLRENKNTNITVYSRDEMKQWEMSQSINSKNLNFLIGDVRDESRLIEAMKNVDICIHAAATKIVPTAEYNPFECIKTNINGAANVIKAAIQNKVKRVVALSTDKASNPINLYGATKLCSDKLFIAANTPSITPITSFSIVRYGNVMCSRGSVIPFFLKQAKTGELSITDERMTRFMISLEEGVSLVLHAIEDMKGGEIYVKKIPSMNIMEIANAVGPDCKKSIIGIRPGEKIHEQMIGQEDAPFTYEYEDYYKILPMIYDYNKDENRINKGKLVPVNFSYSSDTNAKWMSQEELMTWLITNKEVNEQ